MTATVRPRPAGDSPEAATPAADANGSQTVRAEVRLRELILTGELGSGERLTEQALVDRLGMSRTPIRTALVRLAEEGLLAPQPAGGFAVQSFSETEIHDAIEIRGTLEGVAARLAAERGVKPKALGELKDVLARLDDVVSGPLGEEGFQQYIALNARFHEVVVELAASDLLARQIQRVSSLSFASPSAFVRVQAAVPEGRDSFVIAQAQHRLVVEAIENREGARAEALMREHARIAHGNLRHALANQHELARLLPGASLIRRGGAR